MRRFKLTAKTVTLTVYGTKSLLKSGAIKRKTSPDVIWKEFLQEKCDVDVETDKNISVGVNRHVKGKYGGGYRAKLSDTVREFIERNYKRAMKDGRYSVRIFSDERRRPGLRSRPEAMLIDLSDDEALDEEEVEANLGDIKRDGNEELGNEEGDSLQVIEEVEVNPAAVSPELNRKPKQEADVSPLQGSSSSVGKVIKKEDGNKAHGRPNVSVKKEKKSRRFKFDRDDCNSILSDLHIPNENIRPGVMEALAKCSNSFLLTVREELRELILTSDRHNTLMWEKVLKRAPRSAHLLQLLLKPV